MRVLEWLLGPEAEAEGETTHLLPRWIVLRALGLIYFSAFYSYLFQVRGLIGPQGILPAGEYLPRVKQALGAVPALWYAPTLLWLGSSDRALMIVCWLGIAASLAVVLNLWPRLSLFLCLICFLSFVAAGQEFSSYQSDGMLLEAGFISLFFAPPGLRPGLGAAHAPSRLSRFLLQWEWFRIYFGSGVVKLASGDTSWRHLTAMDDYYQNGPLPTWIGWYVQQLPHRFHAFTALLTLAMELGIVFMLFLPRRWRIICFWIVTPFQMGIILTANYAFLNYLVLVLGVLLLDDGFVRNLGRNMPPLKGLWAYWINLTHSLRSGLRLLRPLRGLQRPDTRPGATNTDSVSLQAAPPPVSKWNTAQSWRLPVLRFAAGICLFWVLYATTALLLAEIPHADFLPLGPARAVESFRIANDYGLFANMTHERYEIEFQGSNDGQTWTPYPFRYKPQAPDQAPGIYAPYQPRFEWNLWFASLGRWRDYPFVVLTEQRLLAGSPAVLKLFAFNPFPKDPPEKVRAEIWQYWFTDLGTKRKTGAWWRRELLGLYAPPLERNPEGKIEFSR